MPRDTTNPKRTIISTWLPTDLSGNALHDPLASYHVADIPTVAESSNDTKYYGYLAFDGSWYIMRSIDSTGAYRFTRGADNYPVNFAQKAVLTYDYANVIFGGA